MVTSHLSLILFSNTHISHHLHSFLSIKKATGTFCISIAHINNIMLYIPRKGTFGGQLGVVWGTFGGQ